MPLEPLDLEEGKEVVVSIEDVRSPNEEALPILEMIDELHQAVPQHAPEDLPSDGAKNYKSYLYGRPKDEAK